MQHAGRGSSRQRDPATGNTTAVPGVARGFPADIDSDRQPAAAMPWPPTGVVSIR